MGLHFPGAARQASRSTEAENTAAVRAGKGCNREGRSREGSGR